MITLRPQYLIFVFVSLLCACSNPPQQAEETKPLDDVDTLYLEPGSQLTIQRYRIYKNKRLSFGKMGMWVHVDDMQTGVTAVYPVDSGMMIYNSEYFTAHCFIGTSQIKTLQMDSTDQPGMKTPVYLLRGNKPFIELEYKGNFYPKERAPSASCYLSLNDSTALLNNAENALQKKDGAITHIQTSAYVDGLKWHLFEPVKEEEIKKDSIRLKVNLRFEKRQPVKRKDEKIKT
jgi:hypothetical protein